MRVRLLLLAAAVPLTVACSKKSDDKPAAKTQAQEGKTAPAKPEDKPKQPLTAAWLGKTVAPPGELAKIKLGSTKDEAVKASPLADKAGTQESEIEGVAYAVQDGLEGIETMIRMPADKLSVIEQAWGPGQKVDRGGKPVIVWFNPEQGIRAAFSDEGENRAYLRFEPYTPVAKLLGEGPNIAVLDKPFEGKTADEIKADYPNLVGKTGHLSLPSTEWEFGSGITLSPYPMSGKVESLAFSIPFKTPEGQAEIMKVIEAKWGKAKGEVPFGSVAGEKTFIYNKKNPHIEVTEPGGYNKDKVTIRIGGK